MKINAANIEECLPEKSFFRRWLDVWPTAEPPKSYLLFSGLTMLGAALGRKVWFDQDFHKIRPILNVLFIGPSGIGKSTSIYMGKQLVDSLPIDEQPQFIDGAATVERLHEDLRFNPQTILFASELANFFSRKKYMEDMIPYVTELLDYKAVLSRRTKSGGIVDVIEPAVTVVGGSTVEWLQDQLPDNATSGGFLARFLIIAEECKGQKVANPQKALTSQQRVRLAAKRELVYDEFFRCTRLEGECDYRDYEAMDAYTVWYSTYTPDTGHLAPFAARAGEMILRMAILLAVSCGTRKISAEHLESAIALYEYTASKLQGVVVPMTLDGKMLAQVMQAIGPGAAEQDVCRAMRNIATSQTTQKLLQSLLMSKDLVLTNGKYHRVVR